MVLVEDVQALSVIIEAFGVISRGAVYREAVETVAVYVIGIDDQLIVVEVVAQRDDGAAEDISVRDIIAEREPSSGTARSYPLNIQSPSGIAEHIQAAAVADGIEVVAYDIIAVDGIAVGGYREREHKRGYDERDNSPFHTRLPQEIVKR